MEPNESTHKPSYEGLAHISSWYGSLRPLFLDLVGDYAGEELFFIEGDSLCLHVFGDTRIEITDGPAVVHGIYVMEKFLSNLKQRGCNFHIVFFESHRLISFDHGKVDSDKAFRYILIRDAFICHLQQSISSDNPVKVHLFNSLNDLSFKKYLDEAKPYFCMAHDATTTNGDRKEQYYLQSAILWRMMLNGYNIALLDTVEFKDSKAMTYVVEGYSFSQFTESIQRKVAEEMADAFKVLEEEFEFDDIYTTTEIKPEAEKYIKHPREYTVIAVLSGVADEDYKTRSLVEKFGYAFLHHTVLMDTLSLEERCLPDIKFDSSKVGELNDFIDNVCRCMSFMLEDFSNFESLKQMYPDTTFNLCDIIDIRLFKYCLANQGFGDKDSAVETLSKALEIQAGIELSPLPKKYLKARVVPRTGEGQLQLAVLPFNHSAFDSHLSVIKLDVDDEDVGTIASLHRLAPEKTHWHSSRALKGETKVRNKWEQRADQIYHSQMQRYAASITGQNAQTLEPELIIVDESIETERSKREGKAKQNVAHIDIATSSRGSNMPQKGKGKNSSNSGRKKADIIREKNMKAKSQKSDDKISIVWTRLLDELVGLTDNAADFQEACLMVLARLFEFQKVKLKSDSTSYIYLETRVYRLSVLLDLWRRACGKSKKEKENHQNLAALILDECRHILDSPALTRKVVNIVTKVWVDMGFGDLSKTLQPQAKDNLSSQIKSCRVNPEMRITQSPVEFQLMFSGPYMDRSFGSAPDPRVKFQPDTWQREVLDEIDANKSVFVVAPTSAGKTFISFYAMEKVLRGSNNGILVYVAPTKALVNQIAAEVLARFTKNYPHAGQTVWAIHTRDYRINNPEQCQILITVPHILQIMLLSPHNAEKWAPRVKRIIFDEVHSIGQADDGVIWEQLLLIAPCPIIALSATVGNPDEFRDWLVETQKAGDIDLKMIQHQYRYSDLRKFTYHTSAEEVFTGLGERRHFQELDEPNFVAINPISTLLDVKHRNIPDDLSLEPRDCLELYASMMKHQTEDWTVNPDLNPSQCFSGVIGKVDVIKWEAALKRELGKWMAQPDSPYDRVMEDLTRTRHVRHPHKGNRDPSPSPSPTRSEISSIETIEDDAHDTDETTRETTLSLLARLHAKNALPTILFSFDRTMVEKTATTILKQLEEAEAEFKKTDKEYLDKVKRYYEWVKQQKQKPKSSDKTGDKSQNKNKSRKNKDDEIDALKNERNQEEREDPSKWTLFDPNAPHEKFLFAGKVNHDIEEDFAILEKANVPEVFISVLRRGIGIHHAGLSRRLREATETLFRMGYLKIVIATGTLALGINMPCKTVGFLGDSVYLTALSYRQCSGRAGRRGFDLFGNVIFHGLSRAKVNRLICSRLPSLKGHFPISTSLVLRMFSLLGGSNESQYSKKAVSQLLSQSRLFLGGDSFKEQVLHHLRFSVEYLRRQQLIDGRGSAINFAGLVGHLYYTENSAFAFHALLKEGVLHTICKDVERKPQRTCMVLMMVLAHIFGRRRCKDPKYMSQKMLETIKRSPSEVFLEALPGIAQRALKKHNEETVATFTTYATTFATQHCKNLKDNVLPFSGVNVGGTAAWACSQVHARSTFYRLSGRDDRFNTIKDLATSARRGVFLESSTVPIVDFKSGYVNAYLLDFYKHGSIRPLVTANGLRRNDVWFLLNDFSMILATIVTSVKNFLSERERGLSEDDLFTVFLGDVEEADAGQERLVFESEDADGDIDISSVSHAAVNDPVGLLKVLKAFFLLKRQFDVKLAAIGATKKPQKRGKERKPRLRVDV